MIILHKLTIKNLLVFIFNVKFYITHKRKQFGVLNNFKSIKNCLGLKCFRIFVLDTNPLKLIDFTSTTSRPVAFPILLFYCAEDLNFNLNIFLIVSIFVCAFSVV